MVYLPPFRQTDGGTLRSAVVYCLDCAISQVQPDTEAVSVSIDLLRRLKDGILY